MKRLKTLMLLWLCTTLFLPTSALAADNTAQTFKKEEIEQLVAPIALYPDALVAQILMASTYPLEVVEAARWSKANPKVQGDALEKAMEEQKWDPSVKSLTAFPQVIAGMSDKLEVTQKLGDAFLAQQKEVMEAIQRLRGKAEQAGNLKSGKEQTITTTQDGGTTVIKIEPANPEVVYVPTYNPAVVYGPWPYPAYPPYYYYPYPPGAAFFTFTAGVIVGNALWGNCNWRGNNVYINHNTYNNFNKTNIGSGNSNWQHNAEHRKGVQYRDQASQQNFGKGQREGAQSREEFRGRAEQGRQEIARGGADNLKGQVGAADRAGGGQRDAAGGRANTRDAGGARASAGGGSHSGAFGGAGQGGHTREASQRGATSRASSAGHARSRGGGGRRR